MDAIAVSILVIVATLLLMTERMRPDLVALFVLAALVLLRVIDPDAALSGFSNAAVVTVACMFVLSAGLQASGAVEYLGDRLLLHGPTGVSWLTVLTGLVIAPVSAFINNTAVVAIFLPIVLRACRGNRINPSLMMMPLSFFAMLGGTCTLIGTSTNLLVSSIARQHGVAPFGMFEFTGLGLLLFLGGAGFLLLVGRHILPERAQIEGGERGFGLDRYLSELMVMQGSPMVGKTIVEARLGERYQLEVLGHVRDKVMRGIPDGYGALRPGDVLLVKAPVDTLLRLGDAAGLAVKPGRHPDVAELGAADSVLLEAVIPPNSDLEGRTLKGVDFRNRFGATTLAIRRHGDVRQKIGKLRLRVGDDLLILAPRRSLERLRQQTSFVVLQELDLPVLDPVRAATACAIVAGVVAVATVGVYRMVEVAVVGAVLMVLTGCLPARRAYQSIDWSIIFLLAGLIPLGVALETTGVAGYAVSGLMTLVGDLGPHVVLSAFFLMTAVLTGFMSNNATAVLLGPLALTTAQALGVDSRPFLIALTFAASAAFWTPIGYQTNLLVYGPGSYRYADFVRVGGPMTLIYWMLGSLLIPWLFPF